jgi:hypothetical protein
MAARARLTRQSRHVHITGSPESGVQRSEAVLKVSSDLRHHLSICEQIVDLHYPIAMRQHRSEIDATGTMTNMST